MPTPQASNYLTPHAEPALCPSHPVGITSALLCHRSPPILFEALAQEPLCQAMWLPSRPQFIPLGHFVLLYTRLTSFLASTYQSLAILYQARKISQPKSWPI